LGNACISTLTKMPAFARVLSPEAVEHVFRNFCCCTNLLLFDLTPSLPLLLLLLLVVLPCRPLPVTPTSLASLLHSILLSWLAGIYHGVSGSQAILHGELLQPEFTASGMVAPFVQPVPPKQAADGSLEPSTGARFGVPGSTDVLCDNASELLRMAAAAIISLFVYLNFQQGPGDLPADEVTLTFATVTIHSCAHAANAAAIDTQLQQLVGADVAERGEASAWQQQQQQQQAGGQQQQAQQQFGCAQVGGDADARMCQHDSCYQAV
jgi:hypothetical protein